MGPALTVRRALRPCIRHLALPWRLAVVISPKMVVEIVRDFHNHANLTALQRVELIQRVFRAVTVNEVPTIDRASLLVVLKLLGQHAEPQHLTYLVQSQARSPAELLSIFIFATPGVRGRGLRVSGPAPARKRAWRPITRH